MTTTHQFKWKLPPTIPYCDYTIMMLFCISGTIGHVAHGKSTVVKALSGVQVNLTFML